MCGGGHTAKDHLVRAVEEGKRRRKEEEERRRKAMEKKEADK